MGQREGAEHDDVDRDDRHCPACGTLMKPKGLRSGEIVGRCPSCEQIAI